MLNNNKDKTPQQLIAIINKLLLVIAVLFIGIISMPFIIKYSKQKEVSTANSAGKASTINNSNNTYWAPADIETVTDINKKKQLVYGKDLIAHTAKYLGPQGSVIKMSNGLNCQNCHLQAGTAVFGNNYGSVASLYPKFRARSGTEENIYKRVNDCFERSLNGKSLDTTGKEMQAIVAYIKFIGSNVEKGKKAEGSGLKELSYLDRAADPVKGKIIYASKCQSCHQQNGEGLFNADKTEYIYPPLWGDNSYNDGAGLYRLSNFAKYVKYNMPQGVTHNSTQLSDEEAWDVAAFVNSQERPHINVPYDWPDISKKPVDHPFGPYADSFSEQQHKFGPFKPIIEFHKNKEEASKQKKSIVSIK